MPHAETVIFSSLCKKVEYLALQCKVRFLLFDTLKIPLKRKAAKKPRTSVRGVAAFRGIFIIDQLHESQVFSPVHIDEVVIYLDEASAAFVIVHPEYITFLDEKKRHRLYEPNIFYPYPHGI